MIWAQFSKKLVERFGDSFEEKPVPHDESSNEGETLPPPSLLPTGSLSLSPLPASSWEAVEDLKGQFSNFNLEDKAVLAKGAIDSTTQGPTVYTRRGRKAAEAAEAKEEAEAGKATEAMYEAKAQGFIVG